MSDKMRIAHAHLNYYDNTEDARKVLEKQLKTFHLLMVTAQNPSLAFLEHIRACQTDALAEYHEATKDAADEWALDTGAVHREPWER